MLLILRSLAYIAANSWPVRSHIQHFIFLLIGTKAQALVYEAGLIKNTQPELNSSGKVSNRCWLYVKLF